MLTFTPSSALAVRRLPVALAFALTALLFALGACSSGGGGGGGSSSSGSTTTTSTFSAPDCSSGTTSQTFGSGVPQWIQDNFKCIAVSVSGSNLVILTHDLPPWDSAYYATTDALYDGSMPSQHTVNPNKISEQTLTLTIPSTPPTSVASTASASNESALGVVGVAIDGVAIFNSSAAPGDSLSNEVYTLDENNGHPTNGGVYHYHTEPTQISDDDAVLIGVALDGMPIYGAKDSAVGSDVFNSSSTTAVNWHCHATTEFPSGVCHYHVLTGYSENTTEIIGSVASGTATPLRYMVKYYGGTAGSYTSASASSRIATMLATAAWCGAGSPRP